MSNNTPVIFNFDQSQVRIFSDKDNNPLFVAIDAAKALGYKNTDDAIRRHCKNTATHAKRGGGFLTVIPEPDLYRLIFRSKLKAAERFADWVFEQVLPSIRKTGQYQIDPPSITKQQQGELFNLVSQKASGNNKYRAAIWSRFANHFKTASYKDLPQSKFNDAIDYLTNMVIESKKTNKHNGTFLSGTKRLFVVIEDGIITHTKDMTGMAVVDAGGVETIRRNLHVMQEQMHWLAGERSGDTLEQQLIDVH